MGVIINARVIQQYGQVFHLKTPSIKQQITALSVIKYFSATGFVQMASAD
jgi:hypothetical protein